MPRARKTHDLKTDPDFFVEVWAGLKPFEIRKDDRGFCAGDWLLLREYDRESESYSGRELTAEVTYVLCKFAGLKDGFVVMGIRVQQRATASARLREAAANSPGQWPGAAWACEFCPPHEHQGKGCGLCVPHTHAP